MLIYISDLPSTESWKLSGFVIVSSLIFGLHDLAKCDLSKGDIAKGNVPKGDIAKGGVATEQTALCFPVFQNKFYLFFPGVICLAVPTALRASKEAMSSTVTSHEKRPESRFQCSGYFKGTNSQPAQTKSLERLALARSSECSSGRGFLRRTPSIRSGSRVGDDAIHC